MNLIMHAQRTDQNITPREALRWSLSRMLPDECALLEDIIADCAHRRDFMLSSPTHLRDKLVELDHDLGGLPGRRVSLLGFRDPNAKRVYDNVRALCEVPGWTVIDLRNAPTVLLSESLMQAIASPKLAMLVDVAAALPTDASLLIRALHDSREAVRWVDGTQSPLPAKRMLYVVAVGARSIKDLQALLRRIDFMTFIYPPE